MYLTKNMKIYGSILLAIVIVGVPLYQMTFEAFGSNEKYVIGSDEKYVISPPELIPIEPIPINQPPVCIMDYDTVIHMTTETTFYLDQDIDLDRYFRDPETKDLDYSVVFRDAICNVTLNDHYLESVTTYDESCDGNITVLASDGFSQASYNFTLAVSDREIINLDEDTTATIDVRQYVPFTPETYSIECMDGVNANLTFDYFLYIYMSIVPIENYWGNGLVAISLYDEPNFFPIPPFPIDECSLLGGNPTYTYGYFEFDVEINPVNDPPRALNELTYQLLVTENTVARLPWPVPLDEMFEDVDSQLEYSWMSANGLGSIGIENSNITSIAGGPIAGEDTITIVAIDGEYMTTFPVTMTIVPRTLVEMSEDTTSVLDLQDVVDETTQDYIAESSDNVIVGALSADAPSTTLDPKQDWFGNDVISIAIFPKIFGINPPIGPITIDSAPPGPSIPPMPAADKIYGMYEFDINVAGVNDPPYIVFEPTVTMVEDGIAMDVFNLEECFGDVDSVLQYSLEASAGQIVVYAGLGGGVSVLPASNWFGTGTVTVTASDGEFTISQEVPVQVLPVNDIPFATDADCSFTLDEDTDITISLNDLISDIDDSLWFSYVSYDGNSTVVLNETTWDLAVEPDENWNGIISMTVYGSDGESQLARNLILNVAPVNDRPETISTEGITTAEDTPIDIDLSTYITDMDSELEYSAFSSEGRLVCERVQGSTWSLSASAEHWYGCDTIKVMAYDGEFMLIQNIDIEIQAVNDMPLPVTTITNVTMAEDTVYSFAVHDMFEDVDGDELTYSFEIDAALQYEFVSDSGMLTVTPSENWNGNAEVRIFSCDGLLQSGIEIPVSVLPINDPPYLISGIPSIALVAGNSTNITLSGLFSDIDSHVLTIEVFGTENLEVTPMDSYGVFNVRSIDSSEGSQTLLVRASDGEDVTETMMTVSTYIPDVTTQAAVSGGGFMDNVYWMMFGVAMAVALFVAYTATETRKMNSRPAAHKGRVL